MDLHEDPLRPSAYGDVLSHPRREARLRRWIGRVERAGFYPRRGAPRPQSERDGPFDQEQTILSRRTDAHGLTVHVRSAPRHVATRVVDRVHDPGLRLVGRAREREIDVAAELPEKVHLVVDPAPSAVT